MNIEKVNSQIKIDTEEFFEAIKKDEDNDIVRKLETLIKSLGEKFIFDIKEIDNKFNLANSDQKKVGLKKERFARAEQYNQALVSLADKIK